jgi:hypothetical protein
MTIKKIFMMVAAFGIIGCSSEEVTSPMGENDVIQNLKFETLKSYMAKHGGVTRSTEVTAEGGNLSNGEDGLTMVICSWDKRGRTSKNCRGFGLCHFKWFPGWNLALADSTLGTNPYVAEISTNTVGQKFLNVLLADSVACINVADIPELCVDTDIVSDNTVENTDSTSEEEYVILKEGSYKFQSDLGEYGGYRINVENGRR